MLSNLDHQSNYAFITRGSLLGIIHYVCWMSGKPDQTLHSGSTLFVPDTWDKYVGLC